MPEAKSFSAPVRPFWSGTITFGLVSIPVDLFAAVTPRQKSMKLVDVEGHALGRRYWCPKDEKIVDGDELVRGYETADGKTVVITDEEFASAAPEKSRDIDLKRFVPLDAIPPFFFDRPYILAPDERAGKAYALLARTMAKTGKAGIGSFVMRGHEYLVAILAENGLLRAEVLRYADELRTPASIGVPKPGKGDAGRVRALAKEIDALSKPGVDPAELSDQEAAALHKLAADKAKSGQGVVKMADLEDPDDEGGSGGEVIDLMDVLRKSLGVKAAGAGALKSSSASAKKAPAAAKESTPKKSAVKKAAVKKAPAKKAAPAKPAPAKKGARKKSPAARAA